MNRNKNYKLYNVYFQWWFKFANVYYKNKSTVNGNK